VWPNTTNGVRLKPYALKPSLPQCLKPPEIGRKERPPASTLGVWGRACQGWKGQKMGIRTEARTQKIRVSGAPALR